MDQLIKLEKKTDKFHPFYFVFTFMDLHVYLFHPTKSDDFSFMISLLNNWAFSLGLSFKIKFSKVGTKVLTVSQIK